MFIFEAGESISIITDTNNGLNVWVAGILVDASSPYKRYALFSLANGNNTLYTVPAGKIAMTLANTGNARVTTGVLQVLNASGGARLYTVYFVPSGGAAGATNQYYQAQNVGNNSLGQVGAPSSALNAGDFIVLNTNAATATQAAFVMVVELPV
jgi:hypothetical protein